MIVALSDAAQPKGSAIHPSRLRHTVGLLSVPPAHRFSLPSVPRQCELEPGKGVLTHTMTIRVLFPPCLAPRRLASAARFPSLLLRPSSPFFGRLHSAGAAVCCRAVPRQWLWLWL